MKLRNMKVPTFLSKCTELGFEFQHAQNGLLPGLLVMTRWLPKDEVSSRLPHLLTLPQENRQFILP